VSHISASRVQHVSTVRDGHSFAKRIVNMWDSVPDSVVLSKSVATFRHKELVRIAGELVFNRFFLIVDTWANA